MEQAISDTTFPHESHADTSQICHNVTVNNGGTHHVQHSFLSRDPQRWTSSGSYNGEDIRDDMSRPSACRDYLRGVCTRGLSCKFQHSDIAGHGGARFYVNDQDNSRHVADPRNSQLFSQNKDFGSSGRSFFRDSREPCRNFRSGRCYRGSTCAYLHLPFSESGRPMHDQNVEQPRGVMMASKNLGFHQGYEDKNLQISQDHDDRVLTASRNSISHERHMGNSVQASQVHDVPNKENNLRVSFSREPRSKSPCRNFLQGRCQFGTSCRRWHPVDVCTRIWNSEQQPGIAGNSNNHGFADKSHQHISLRSGPISADLRSRPPCQYFRGGDFCKGGPSGSLHPHHQGVTSTTRDPSFNRGNGVREFNCQGPYQDPHTGYKIPFNDNRGAINTGYTSWSSERKRSRPGSDQIQPEVCLKFTKGRCDQGEHCRYLHSFHEYASSVSQQSQKPRLEEANEGLMKRGETVVFAHDIGKDDQMQSNNVEHNESGLDNSFDKETNAIINSNPADGNETIGLWNPPFKRQRTWSRPSFSLEASFRGRAPGEDYSLVSRYRSRCYDQSRTQYPDRRSFQVAKPANRMNNGQPATSLNPSLHVDTDSIVMSSNGHGNATNCETHSDRCLSGSSLSEAAVVSKNNEVESATNALQSNQAGQKTMDSVNQEPVEPDSTRFFDIQHSREANLAAAVLEKCETSGTKVDLNYELNDKTGAGSEPSDAPILKSIRKLLVLDVNGLLADIVANFPERCKPDAIVAGKGVFKRPFCDDFLQFCFEKYDVGIWSSRMQKNVTRVLDCLMENTKNKLLFCWDQSHCTQTGFNTVENKAKPLVLKELKKLWEKQEKDLPWQKGFYDETNTILLDDSPYKALRNPPFTAIFPSPYTFKQSQDKSLGPDGDLRLYLERLAEAENVQKFIQENHFGQRPITKTNLSWPFYSKIAGESAIQQKQMLVGEPNSS